MKKLEKIERIVVPTRVKHIRFSFPQPPRSGKRVMAFEHVEVIPERPEEPGRLQNNVLVAYDGELALD